MTRNHGVSYHTHPIGIANFLQSGLCFIEIYVKTYCVRRVQKDDGVSLVLSL